MKLLCDRQQLTDAFTAVAAIAPQKSTKPIVLNVCLKASAKEGLVLFATDYQMSVRMVVDAVKVEKPGVALLPARETMALLRELSEPTITVSTKDLRSTIDSGSGSFILLGGDPDEFPPEQSIDESTKTVSIPAARLVEMLKKTVFASAREESRYAVPGVLWDCKDSCLNLVATDGRRLSLNYQQLEDAGDGLRAVAPTTAVVALSRLLGEDDEGDVEVSFGSNQIGFRCQGMVLLSRILDQNFPDYQGVIPKVAETTVEVRRSELESAVRRVAVLCSHDARQVRCTFSGTGLQISAESSTVGRGDVTVDCDVKGAGCTVLFNPDFMLDALRVADRDVVQIALTDESVPARFTLGESFTYVLMPITG